MRYVNTSTKVSVCVWPVTVINKTFHPIIEDL